MVFTGCTSRYWFWPQRRGSRV